MLSARCYSRNFLILILKFEIQIQISKMCLRVTMKQEHSAPGGQTGQIIFNSIVNIAHFIMLFFFFLELTTPKTHTHTDVWLTSRSSAVRLINKLAPMMTGMWLPASGCKLWAFMVTWCINITIQNKLVKQSAAKQSALSQALSYGAAWAHTVKMHNN